MKHLIFFFTLFVCGNSFSQIWKEPFDTLAYYYDHLEKLSGDKLAIKSYTVSMFEGNHNPVQFDFFGFDEKGNLVQQCMGESADQVLDTLHYFYNEAGVFQEAISPGQNKLNAQRNFFYNENGHIASILYTDRMITAETRFSYNSKNLLDSIIYSGSNWTCFLYDDKDMLSKKVIYRNKVPYEYFNYSFPYYQAISYSNCLVDADLANPCEKVTAFYNEFGKIARLDIVDQLNPAIHHSVISEYDGDGNISKVTYEEPTGNTETTYIRDKKGLLLRVEHVKDGEVYNYSVFEYVYR